MILKYKKYLPMHSLQLCTFALQRALTNRVGCSGGILFILPHTDRRLVDGNEVNALSLVTFFSVCAVVKELHTNHAYIVVFGCVHMFTVSA